MKSENDSYVPKGLSPNVYRFLKENNLLSKVGKTETSETKSASENTILTAKATSAKTKSIDLRLTSHYRINRAMEKRDSSSSTRESAVPAVKKMNSPQMSSKSLWGRVVGGIKYAAAAGVMLAASMIYGDASRQAQSVNGSRQLQFASSTQKSVRDELSLSSLVFEKQALTVKTYLEKENTAADFPAINSDLESKIFGIGALNLVQNKDSVSNAGIAYDLNARVPRKNNIFGVKPSETTDVLAYGSQGLSNIGAQSNDVKKEISAEFKKNAPKNYDIKKLKVKEFADVERAKILSALDRISAASKPKNSISSIEAEDNSVSHYKSVSSRYERNSKVPVVNIGQDDSLHARLPGKTKTSAVLRGRSSDAGRASMKARDSLDSKVSNVYGDSDFVDWLEDDRHFHRYSKDSLDVLAWTRAGKNADEVEERQDAVKYIYRHVSRLYLGWHDDVQEKINEQKTDADKTFLADAANRMLDYCYGEHRHNVLAYLDDLVHVWPWTPIVALFSEKKGQEFTEARPVWRFGVAAGKAYLIYHSFSGGSGGGGGGSSGGASGGQSGGGAINGVGNPPVGGPL